MKILFVLELYYPNIGGIEKLFKSLAEKLVEEGHEVTVVTSRFDKELASGETIAGVRIKRLNIRSRFLFTFFGIFGMMREARNCDIIHTTSYNAAFPARLAGWLYRKKVLITFHEAWGKLWFKLPWANMVSKSLYYIYESFILHLRFHRFIAVSDYTARCLHHMGIRKSKISMIYNGLDYKQYNPEAYSPPEKFTFTFFGRLGISKGLDLLLESAPEFLSKHPDARLRLILPTRPKGFFRRIKKKLNSLPDKQYELYHNLSTDELQNSLQHSSCVVIPSYSEGFCFAAAECVALGIPIISSGKGALKEVVSGKYIEMDPFNPKGLTDALEKAFAGQWTEIPVKQFHFRDTVEAYLKLYEG